jgi:hypothetical protein
MSALELFACSVGNVTWQASTVKGGSALAPELHRPRIPANAQRALAATAAQAAAGWCRRRGIQAIAARADTRHLTSMPRAEQSGH